LRDQGVGAGDDVHVVWRGVKVRGGGGTYASMASASRSIAVTSSAPVASRS
jgi:hypothetical protein